MALALPAAANAADAIQVAADAIQFTVEPSAVRLTASDQRVQLLVTGKSSDGERDLTREVRYEASDPTIAVVENGYVRPLKDGQTVVSIRYGNSAAEQPIAASLNVTVQNMAVDAPVNFAAEVVPIFSKYGCNAGACHGKLAGQNGFRLSLFGFDPKLDHETLVKEARGRRLFPAAPEQSLLLQKATGTIPHRGGMRFDATSEPYVLLRRWITQGAPNTPPNAPQISRVEVFPRERIATRRAQQQLRVVATYTDGAERDVTRVAEYRSQANDLLQVDPDGLVRTSDVGGEGTILVRFAGLLDIARFSVPFSRAVPDAAYAAFQPANFIDDASLNKWRTLGIEPSGLSTDEEFLRRMFLDLIGTLPTPDEVRQFVADNRPDKRAVWIDALLERLEFVDYWTLELADLLQNRKERDHDVRGPKGVRDFHNWLREQVAANRPWDALTREILTVRGDSFAQPAVGYYVVTIGENREPEKSEISASVAQSFLGTRILCAKCHNHPTERYTQDDYYRFAAFFGRVSLKRESPEKGPTQLTNDAKRSLEVTQPRTNQRLSPQPLDRSHSDIAPDADPREALAAWLTDPHNEAFSGAMVNRLWRHFLGVGLVEPVDDLRATNPPTNPQLWRELNREFVESRFDLKHLMRTIVNSRTYQLSSTTSAANEHDNRFYSHFYARRLPAEVLLDAISAATCVPDNFPGYPIGLHAVQLPDPGVNSYFLGLFGRSERTTACACERRDDVTVRQLLHMQNGDSVLNKIRDGNGRLAELLKSPKGNSEIIGELFLSVLGRMPLAEESSAVEQSLASAGERHEEALQDLFWALLNTKEFTFNH